MHTAKITSNKGFTLIELLVAMAIMGILMTLSLFALNTSRIATRDTRRKVDLQSIMSGLELYRSDCGRYPASYPAVGNPLIGTAAAPNACATTNTYIKAMPRDPMDPTRRYFISGTATTYLACASLERAPSPAMDVSGCGSCGSSACNYKITNP